MCKKNVLSYVVTTFAFLILILLSASGASKPENLLSDSAITAKIKSKLVSDDRVSAFKIHVNTENKVVKLSGEVNSVEALFTAIEIAYAVNDVLGVDVSNLFLTPKSNYPLEDGIITAKVNGIFSREKIFGEEAINVNINVVTRNGVVYLNGTVNDASYAETAVKTAKSIEGVKEVKNNIKTSY